jgi:hypothetical protein
VSLLAVADHLNAPLLWSLQVLSRYRWSISHVPSYESHSFQVRVRVRERGGGRGRGRGWVRVRGRMREGGPDL